MDEYIVKGNKKLRKGYTTGTCAAAAAGCAAQSLLNGTKKELMEVVVPGGKLLQIPVTEIERKNHWVKCAVKKDSGDDPDVTNGTLICATVYLAEKGIVLKAGEGVGTVTKPGLACAVGEPAINPVPRQMIEEQVSRAAWGAGYKGGFIVEISIPEGIRLAEKTFNPKLGIEGGLSILGTSGIVEPMSEDALVATIKLEINMKQAAGEKCLILTPGNYGETFLKDKMKIHQGAVKCSNFIGAALDHCRGCRFSSVLLAGHIGKLIKVAAGMMNTHSRYGDHRMETMAAHVAKQGGDRGLQRALLDCVTTEDALSVLLAREPKLKDKVMDSIIWEVQEQMRLHLGKEITAGVILYSNVYGLLGSTEGAAAEISKPSCDTKQE